MKIGIINVKSKTGGIRTFVDNFYEALKRYSNSDIYLIDFSAISICELNSFDVLHFSGVGRSGLFKMFFITKPRKILTVHGWIKEELLYSLKSGNFLKNIKSILQSLIFYFFIKIDYFDIITCPTQNTANKNNLKNAIIITNAIFPERYDSYLKKYEFNSKKIIFSTYSSCGGNKNKNVDELINLVKYINTFIPMEIELHIFGDYVSKKDILNIFVHGYSNKFLEYLGNSDLFITLKEFPDLGYAEMESGILNVPIAKLKTSNLEEIIDGNTGILAGDREEMARKIISFIKSNDFDKKKLRDGIYKYIKEKKDWERVIKEWLVLFNNYC